MTAPTIEMTPRLPGALRSAMRLGQEALGYLHPNDPALPKAVHVPYAKSSRYYLVTEPDPSYVTDAREAPNIVFKPGLSEFGDVGSPLRLHTTFARENPGYRVITEPTDGMSWHGPCAPFRPNTQRCKEQLAEATRETLPHITKDGTIEIAGTSLGSFMAIEIAEQNAAANSHEQLNIKAISLVASAVIAQGVPENEEFRDLSRHTEETYRKVLTRAFEAHVPDDLFHMAKHYPFDFLACVPVVSAYILEPHKAFGRMFAIKADFRTVQQGVAWSTLRTVADNYDIRVYGGGRDPLIQAQIPQWEALNRKTPNQIKQTIIPTLGHLLTIDARGTVAALQAFNDMERSST